MVGPDTKEKSAYFLPLETFPPPSNRNVFSYSLCQKVASGELGWGEISPSPGGAHLADPSQSLELVSKSQSKVACLSTGHWDPLKVLES